MAQVSFSDLFKSSSGNQLEESSSFAGSLIAGATNIRFVSQNPAQVSFSGNNVPGDLYYTLGGIDYSVRGIVSRQVKTGSTTDAFYFADSGTDYVLGSTEQTWAYLLEVPTRSIASGTYSLSSDPVDAKLNTLLASQPTLVDITQNEADLTLNVGQTFEYTFTFSTDIDADTFTSADIANIGTATVTIVTITETSPGVFKVQVKGDTTGTVQLSIPAGSVIKTPTGLGLNTASAIKDNQTLNVVAAGAGLLIDKASASTSEDLTSDTFSFHLNEAPTDTVLVTLTGLDETEGSLSTTTLTFTTTDWSEPQTVTVTGVDDPSIDGDITYSVTLSAASTDSDYNGKTGSVAVVNDDNDFPDPEPEIPPFTANLDPTTDTGDKDNVTKNTEPEFTLNGGTYLQPGRTAQLVDPSGAVIGSAPVTPADVTSGKINVPTPTLDDGVYTYTAQIVDDKGNVVASAPVTVTVVTDLDGVMPSVELAANGGDYNRDGVADWQQNNVAQLPMSSVTAYQQGKSAPAQSFGAVIAGSPDAASPSGVKLQDSAQLENVRVLSLPVQSLPQKAVAQTPLYDFTVTSQKGSNLADLNPDRDGLQLQTVILLPAGVQANAYMKYDRTSGTWTNFTNAAALDGSQDGAALVDNNGDGKVDRIVVTITDGGPGDEDGLVNGKIVDPGALAVVPPQIQGPSGGLGDLASQKTIPENTLPVAKFSANEPVSWAISGGNDQQLFGVDAGGNLVFKAAPDYELPTDTNKDNVYLLQIQATNAVGAVSVQNVTVTVTDVPERVPVYGAPLSSTDRWLSLDNAAAQKVSVSPSPVPVDFYGTQRKDADAVHLVAWKNALTGDYFYAPEGVAPPYACYVRQDTIELGNVLKPGKGAFDVHLYLNQSGITQLVGQEQATQMGLISKGYIDMGALFASAPDSTLDALASLVGVSSGA